MLTNSWTSKYCLVILGCERRPNVKFGRPCMKLNALYSDKCIIQRRARCYWTVKPLIIYRGRVWGLNECDSFTDSHTLFSPPSLFLTHWKPVRKLTPVYIYERELPSMANCNSAWRESVNEFISLPTKQKKFHFKKVTLIFGTRYLLSLKNCLMCPENNFSRFSRKILLFSKKLLNKKIFSF